MSGQAGPGALRWVVVGLAFIALAPLLALSALAIVRIPMVYAGDYESYVAAATRWVSGDPVYPSFQLAGPFPLGMAAMGTGFVYPPPALLTGLPFAWMPEPIGFAAFSAVTGGCLGVAVYLVGRGEGLGPRGGLLLVVAVLASAPAIESILTGQANTGVAALLAVAWLRPRLSGWLALVGGLIKVFPLALFAWAVRERGPVLRPLLVGLVVVGLALIVFGPDTWRDFAVSLGNGTPSSYLFPEPPRHFLDPLVGPTVSALVVDALAAAVITLSVVVPSRYLGFALLSVGMILPAPDWFLHYFIIPLVGIVPSAARAAAHWPAAWRGASAPATP